MINWHRANSGLFLPAPVGTPGVDVTKDIALYDGPNWNGRTNVKRMKDGNFILCYMDSTAHHINTNSKVMVRVSHDGNTWSDHNKYFDGSTITNAPFIPTPSVSNSGAGESWTYIAPNGHVIVHTWNCYYDVYNGGTHQWHSEDHARTFIYDGPVTFIGQTNQGNIFATDDDFVKDGVIYAGARKYLNMTQDQGIKSMFIMNPNNGDVDSWEYISDISSYSFPTNEVGLAFVGGRRIKAVLRGWPVGTTYGATSDDMGQTWTLEDITSGPVGPSGRHRIKSRAFLQGRIDYWNDPLWIMTGFMNIIPDESVPRRSCIWVSQDKCETWSPPIYVDDPGHDGGYNDMMWNGDYKYFTYYSVTDLYDGYVKQIDFDLTFS